MPVKATTDKANGERTRTAAFMARYGGSAPALSEAQTQAIRLVVREETAAVSSKTMTDPADTLVRAIVASQKILADALEPGGSRDQAFALVLGVLDHEEVAGAVAEIISLNCCAHSQPLGG